MSNANITIPVDLTNPGQFFACCGSLELADRLWPDAHVHATFEPDSFILWADHNECTLKSVITEFTKADVRQLDVADNAASPLYLEEPFDLLLNWWKKVETAQNVRIDLGGGDQLKPWAGKQFGPLIFEAMKNACADVDLVRLLDDPIAVYDTKGGKAKKKTISPFYFDARREETSLDVGFSPDEQDMSVVAYPAVESLALIGLQRFRPQVDESGSVRTFLYTVWTEQLEISVAASAVSGMVPVRSNGIYRFTKPSRGGEYLTMFSRATRERSNHA